MFRSSRLALIGVATVLAAGALAGPAAAATTSTTSLPAVQYQTGGQTSLGLGGYQTGGLTAFGRG